MQRPLWFKAKRYGWGWTPCTWQGWLVVGVFVALITADAYRFDFSSTETSPAQLYPWFADTFVLVCVLIVISYYTGEKLRWRWGGKD